MGWALYYVRFEVFTAVTEERERDYESKVDCSERHYRGLEGKEFNSGFEVSQALPVCPSGKCNNLTWDIKPCSYLTGNTLRPSYRAQPVNAV
jgi:hypothetical protein